ncbi:aldose 1-epimerase [Congregibacter litoralis]|nr:aldose 1-epimerase [Congregibacter litoralis]
MAPPGTGLSKSGNSQALMHLECHGLRLEISPREGAALVALQSRRGDRWCDWLVDRELASSTGTPACFPLIPFANRIAHGELEFSPQRLAANRPDLSAHPIHGYAWQAPWDLDWQKDDALQLSYDGSDDPWPCQYRASMVFALAPGELRITLKLSHRGVGEMPAGLGLHPAFPSEGLLSVQADCAAFLAVDDDGLPSAIHRDAQECADLAEGRVPARGVDSDFVDWKHKATLLWRDRALSLSADPVFSALHVFRPGDKALLCLEPVSHLTGAMARERLPSIPSPQMLGSGETLEGSIRFHLEDFS